MDVMLPGLPFAPEVLVEVWDNDLMKDDVACVYRYSLGDPATIHCTSAAVPCLRRPIVPSLACDVCGRPRTRSCHPSCPILSG